MEMENISYILIPETARDICEKYDKDFKKMENWEICKLLDRLIDEALTH